MDEDGGKWLYKNGTISVEITRYTGICAKMEFPYYVADIHMRADEYRSGFGDEKRAGKGKDSAMNIAKKYKAVLLVTGESLPISRRKVTAVRAQYLELVQSDSLVF